MDCKQYGRRTRRLGWGTELEVGRTRVHIHMETLEFFIDINFSPHYGPGVVLVSNMSTRGALK
jgi:hypothetical protein